MKALVIAAVLAFSPQFAHGEIMSGDHDIELTAFPLLNTSGMFTVPGGGSFSLNGTGAAANFNFTAGDSSLLTLSVSGVGLAGVGSNILWEFSDLDITNIAPVTPEVVRSLVFDSAASTPGVTVVGQSFTDDSITITTGDFAATDFEFSFRVSTIPEPTHFGILGVCAIGLLMLKRRSLVSA